MGYAFDKGWIIKPLSFKRVIDHDAERERSRILSPSEEISLLAACQGERSITYERTRLGKSERITARHHVDNPHLKAIVLLKSNNGNRSKTARQAGVNRKTLIAWEKQLESDQRLHRMLAFAVADRARHEEILGVKALAELSLRLDTDPASLKVADLIRLKESATSTLRSLNGTEEPPRNTRTMSDRALAWLARARQMGATYPEMLEYLERTNEFGRGEVWRWMLQIVSGGAEGKEDVRR